MTSQTAHKRNRYARFTHGPCRGWLLQRRRRHRAPRRHLCGKYANLGRPSGRLDFLRRFRAVVIQECNLRTLLKDQPFHCGTSPCERNGATDQSTLRSPVLPGGSLRSLPSSRGGHRAWPLNLPGSVSGSASGRPRAGLGCARRRVVHQAPATGSPRGAASAAAVRGILNVRTGSFQARVGLRSPC